jgi:N-acetylmuramoyl-L-alanine amidase
MVVGLVTLSVAGCGSSSEPAATISASPRPADAGPTPVLADEPAPFSVPSDTVAPLPPPTTSPAAPEQVTPPANPGIVVSRTGVVVPVVGEVPEGVRVRTPCGAAAVLTEGRRIREATVVLDAGHGGAEPGAVSPNGVIEKFVNLAVVAKAKEALEAAGVTVIPTRTGDYDLDLQTRAEIAKSLSPRAFVSVHHNAQPDGPSPKPGTETYFQIGSSDSKRLAGLIYEEVLQALSAYQVAWVADASAGVKFRQGQHGDYYAVLRMPAPVTSVLAELAFISNPEEALLIARPEVEAVEGEAVARGIVRYLTTSDPGSGYTTQPSRVPPPDTGPTTPPPCHDPPL